MVGYVLESATVSCSVAYHTLSIFHFFSRAVSHLGNFSCLCPRLLITALLMLPGQVPAADYPALDQAQLRWLGNRIYQNECAMQTACLTAWNSGEDFPSMGIGHFIWFQAGQEEIFEESFPRLLRFLDGQGVDLPEWLHGTGFASPWPDRESFLADHDGARLTALRELLLNTLDLQTAFIVRRFEQALDALVATSPASQQEALEGKIEAIANASPPHGLYALIDYVNFKGTGLSEQERYRGQGWGLLQVLENMPADSAQPLSDFVTSAATMLETRVRNAPAERDEQRWLRGWHVRLNTYLPDLPDTDLHDSALPPASQRP